MNALGIALVWCVVQVTLIGAFAGALYFVVRRFHAAAAELVLSTALATVVILSLVVLSPWPRWTDRLAGPSARAEAVGETGSGASSESAAPARPRGVSWLVDELWRPPASEAAEGWRWPAVLAAIVVAGMAGGLGWLVLGLVAVRREQLRSQPVLDTELAELVDVLRAELGGRRPIEIRESSDLVTAATVGWLRPVLLLPADWRSWTAPQRRAVLAHEIAHAQSGDFLALFCGQFGQALHFYHPLVHWLVGRLRLEQELAADAAAASVSGGQWEYLTTIAELTLRQQDRALVWPARMFLPTRTTFLRRIAMLRDCKLRVDRLSSAGRLATVGAVLVCGLVAAGFRGPAASSQAAAQDAAKPADSAANIFANPGAESGKRAPDGWQPGAPIPGVRYSWDKKTGCHSRASLCIEKVAQRYFPIAQWSQTVPRTGELPQLEVSAQVKAQNMTKAILDVIFLDKDGQWISHQWAAYIGSKQDGDPPANHDWREYSGKIAIPEGTAKITIALQDYGPGRVWFDDIRAGYAK